MGWGEGGGGDGVGVGVYDVSVGEVVNNGAAPSTSHQNHHHPRCTCHPYLLKKEVEELEVVEVVGAVLVLT